MNNYTRKNLNVASSTSEFMNMDIVEIMLGTQVYCDEMASGVAAASREEIERAWQNSLGTTNTEDCKHSCGGCKG
ncbi:hypothetical protein [Nostoc sp.]